MIRPMTIFDPAFLAGGDSGPTLTTGPTIYWSLDETTSAMVNLVSPGTRDGAVRGTYTRGATGIVDSAIDFTTAAALNAVYDSTGGPAALVTSFGFSVWAKTSDLVTGAPGGTGLFRYGRVIASFGPGQPFYLINRATIYMYGSSGDVGFEYWGGNGGNAIVNVSSVVAADTWVCLGLRLTSAGALSAFVNGALVGTAAVGGATYEGVNCTTDPNAVFSVGGSKNTSSGADDRFFWEGLVDDAIAWIDVAPTDDDFAAHYEAGLAGVQVGF